MNESQDVTSYHAQASKTTAITIAGKQSVRNHWKERGLFLLNFFKNPFRNASVIPSSREASRAIISGINWDRIRVIVELGPGPGTFTKDIIQAAHPDTRIVLIDLESSYVDLLKEKFGQRVVVIHDGANRMNEILDELQLGKADLIVSSLPFLQKEIQTEVFKAIRKQTDQGAIYRFFTYLPPLMKSHYRNLPLHKVKFVAQNIPPMWIYGIN